MHREQCLILRWCRSASPGLVLVLSAMPGMAWAGDQPKPEPGIVQRVEDQARQIGNSLEESFKGTTKKLQDERLPEKVEKKVKEVVNGMVEGVERTGKELGKKFGK